MESTIVSPPSDGPRHRHPGVVEAGLLLLVLLMGCAPDGRGPVEVEVGQTRAEAREGWREPDSIRDFTLPAAAFMGPQEGLARILPPGTLVEEWRYEIGDEIQYVWFAAPPTDPGDGDGGRVAARSRSRWTVVQSATYPADAIF